jgi:hydroxymethylpyrimidine pyrophosphatase-like HAD family hydrolase
MRYHALAADYDGTLATDGRLTDTTRHALERLLASGRKLIMVTGRELDDLQSVCPHLDLFHRIVAENGGWLYRPATRDSKRLAAPPSEAFVKELQRRGVAPLSVGCGIVATWEPHEKTVLEVIRDLGLELQVIFNKGAVMILPAGVNKATGLSAALRELSLSAHNVVGVGDAENDHAFLSMCECAVTVSNALPMLKDEADWVTKGDHGDGVVELIDELLANDLGGVEDRLTRHHILLGIADSGEEISLPSYGPNLLLTGSSGSGKSTLATGLLERIADGGYQFCVIDPEGDYEAFDGAVVLGNSQRVPIISEILQLLANPEVKAIVNLLGLPLQDRPSFFMSLLPHLMEMRAHTGRPHWIAIDEAHHLLPASWDPTSLALSQKLHSMLFVTVHPDQLAKAVISVTNTVIVIGEAPEATVQAFSKASGLPSPSLHGGALDRGEAVVWPVRQRAPTRIRVPHSQSERRRHRRKYAEGELGPDRSFYFQGPEGKLNLRAQNLILFLQLGEGVDDATWMYHLNRGDYSRWFRDAIKDEILAEQAARIEAMPNITPAESRKLIKATVEERYTLPASGITGESVAPSTVPRA